MRIKDYPITGKVSKNFKCNKNNNNKKWWRGVQQERPSQSMILTNIHLAISKIKSLISSLPTQMLLQLLTLPSSLTNTIIVNYTRLLIITSNKTPSIRTVRNKLQIRYAWWLLHILLHLFRKWYHLLSQHPHLQWQWP